MRALLLSAYHTDSHRRWAAGVMRWLDEVDWTLLQLPGRHFAWRMRGNPLHWHTESGAVLEQDYDLVLATSMVDLATLIGLYPNLGKSRKVLYFHENQFEYPLSPGQKRRAEPLMVSLYAGLVADCLLFNSVYNRDTYLCGLEQFMRRMPERLDLSFIEQLAARSRVLPVPLEPRTNRADVGLADPDAAPLILWNHRWEYDKQPKAFFAACTELDRQGFDFRLAVAGQTFRQQPEVFAQAQLQLAHRIEAWGHQPRADYEALLQRSAIVVSTALHEFQGLAMLEAVQAGSIPLVPDRLCYPEFYGPQYRYQGSVEALVQQLGNWLENPDQRPPAPSIEHWEWPAMLAQYTHALYDGLV
ncbi:DUF3524 domain-containing protein [Natronospirillum operosum]|uniref:tRNA-queuosine alpha-mannosyltransferase n=1 Tax=Natronospirillum operosum TaxID=2759953 RepID=A0A4Z0WCW2_9GAMM|nr:DUF3524 domain-containing protein [Natronospirillum operosum]TGG95694.1 DUF3524 domain-containing protein [Natronospirillum operosum]